MSSSKILFLDTETTGLEWHKGDLPFAIIVADESCYPRYYEFLGEASASPFSFSELKKEINSCDVIVMHNAKFDIHMLANIGLVNVDDFKPTVWCTMTMHRYVNNACASYSLSALTGTKSDAVDKWIKANPKIGKYRDENGKLQRAYWRVPTDIMREYAIQDVIALRELYVSQQKRLSKMIDDEMVNKSEFLETLKLECECVKMLWCVERTGIATDASYIEAGLAHELECAENAHKLYKELTGVKFVSSGKSLEKVFTDIGITLPKTAKGNTEVKDSVLATIKHPVAELIRTIRKHEKRANTYFKNYLEMRDAQGRIHPNFSSCGADTLRMSCTNPNLQNVSANSEDNSLIDIKYPLRGCFIPTNNEWELCSIDFAAQEMRCIIDVAEEEGLAKQIINGLDVHQATANILGVNRYTGKTLGFSILYGSGIGLLSNRLSVPPVEAKRLKELYFSRLSNVKVLTRALTNTAISDGYISTVYGNILYIEEEFAYKAVNYFIQGSCAIHTKKAAVSVHKYLRSNGFKTRILAIIHDEILLEVLKSEKAAVLPVIRKLMASAYPHKILPMDTSCEVYSERWDKDGQEIT